MEDTNTDILAGVVADDSTSDSTEVTTSTSSDSSDSSSVPTAPTTPTNVVFVGSLAWATTDETLRQHFEAAKLQIGEDEVVKNEMTGKEYTRRAVTVARYPDTKKSRGYGFVTLASNEEAQKAVDTLNETELDGRNIRVQLKDMTPREDRPRREGGRSFGGGNSYGGGDRRGGNNNFSGGNRRDNYGNRGGNRYESNTDSWAA